jgi:DNA-binding NtrC family response regulator
MPSALPTRPTAPRPQGIASAIAEAERDAIFAALQDCYGNKSKAARQLGISRASLYQKLATLGIKTSDTPS